MLFQILDGPEGSVVNTIVGSKEFVKSTFDYYREVERTAEEQEQLLKDSSRNIRDIRLAECDWIVPLTDHPQHSAYLTYRAALRGWPSDKSGGFPDISLIPPAP
tara:strand:+ start:1236 stop:1547 length:312 start_codon:yes stop_codon:yes gene_type:complete